MAQIRLKSLNSLYSDYGGKPALKPIVNSQAISVDGVKGYNIYNGYLYYGKYDGTSEGYDQTYYNIYRKNLTTGAISLFKYTNVDDNYQKWSLVVNGLNGNIMYLLLAQGWGSKVYTLNLDNGTLKSYQIIYSSGSISGNASNNAIYAKNKIFMFTSGGDGYSYDLATNTATSFWAGGVMMVMILYILQHLLVVIDIFINIQYRQRLIVEYIHSLQILALSKVIICPISTMAFISSLSMKEQHIICIDLILVIIQWLKLIILIIEVL